MAMVSGSSGFGTDPEVLLNTVADSFFREIRGGTERVELRGIRAELDAGNWIRAAGDATVNGGVVLVGRVAVLRGPQNKPPPSLDIGTGIIPKGYTSQDINGYEFLWQATVFAWPQQFKETFDPGEIYAVGDKSLYVVFGGVRRLLAGTIAAPGTEANQITFATMSVSGVDYSYNPTQKTSSQFASLPRYAIGLPSE